ncbi:MAG: hypothetical protein PHF37_10410 [Phycisphaerae bacterium]|nr:hypothetical protein [Phycisphaerae bacterium]
MKGTVLTIFVLAAVFVAFADDVLVVQAPASQTAIEPSQAGEPVLQGNEVAVMTELQKRMRKTISVDFRDTPIEDVVRIIAEQADVDIVLSPNVTGTVTAKLSDIPLEEALSNILAAQGYGYVAGENLIRIAPMAEIAQKDEALVSRIYRITYADVDEVEKSLNKFKSARGTVSSNPGTSNVIVTDTEAKIKAIDTFIEEIDRVTPQILVEVRIYDVTGTDRLDLGVNWSAGTNTTFVGGEATAGNRDPFISTGLSSSVDKTSGLDSGIRFGWLNENIDLNFLLSAEQQDICATLLANPRIMVLDNQKAHFESITEIPYQELTETSSGGSIGTTSFREVGVLLDVIPHVTRDDMVRLRVIPEFSIATGQVQVGGVVVDNAQPVIDKRKADTSLLVKDGQTIVLGGLKKKTINMQTDKVPLLGDIPLLGALFTFNGEEEVNSELVVFLTPHIINEPSLTAEEAKQLDVTEFCGPKACDTKLQAECGEDAKLVIE